jgi:uncharacterized protein YecT (DUF1311 family)
MRRYLACSVAILTAPAFIAAAQEQNAQQLYEQADAKLNQAYNELRTWLTAKQVEELKESQRRWIAERDRQRAEMSALHNNQDATWNMLQTLVEQRAMYLRDQMALQEERNNQKAEELLRVQSQERPLLASVLGIAAGGNVTAVCVEGPEVFLFDNRTKLLMRKVTLRQIRGMRPQVMLVDPLLDETLIHFFADSPGHETWATILNKTGQVFQSSEPPLFGNVIIVQDRIDDVWRVGSDVTLDVSKLELSENDFCRSFMEGSGDLSAPAESLDEFMPLVISAASARKGGHFYRNFVQERCSNHWALERKDLERPVLFFEGRGEGELRVTFFGEHDQQKPGASEAWDLFKFERNLLAERNDADLEYIPIEDWTKPEGESSQKLSNWREELTKRTGHDFFTETKDEQGGLSDLAIHDPDNWRPVSAKLPRSAPMVVGLGGLRINQAGCFMLKSENILLWDTYAFSGYNFHVGYNPAILWDVNKSEALAIRPLRGDSSNGSDKPVLPATQFFANGRPYIGKSERSDTFLLQSDSGDLRTCSIFLYSLPDIKVLKQWDNIESRGSPALQAGTLFVVGSDASSISMYDVEKGAFLGSIIQSGEADLLVVFADGPYAGLTKSKPIVGAAMGNKVYPFEQFDLRLNRPDIVLERLGAPAEAVTIAKQLREKRLKRMGVTDEMLKPDFHVPELEIVGDVAATTDAGEINLAIKASDSKYPLERLKVYVNNVPVNGRDGESLRDQNTQALERTIPIKLAVGRNKIQISVLNNAGAESLYANAEVNCTAQRPKPTLYAVALGVSDYANPDWNLKYAAKDAKDVLERLKTRSGASYGEVKELLLTDKQVTKDSVGQIKDFLRGATIDDTVLMFVAGHGLLDSQYDYYFGTNDIDFNNPAEKGIAFEEFDDLLAGLPCLKKSLLIDTCHAGELDEEEKTLLASAGGTAAPLPTGSGIAMRSIGTRGMNVKAIEGARGASEWYDRLQGLFVDLRRGSGSTILSSSAGAEYALESSEQQNGLFTYAVLEALDGKKDADTNKDGSVQMSELGEYVKKRVSELTNNKQTPNTRRVNLEGDFAVAKTK